MPMNLNITDLTHSCLTRPRAKEAVYEILKQMNNAPLYINLKEAELISMSFLDDLIFYLAASANVRNVVFQTDDSTVLEKLARIASIRYIKIRYQYENNEVQILAPKTSSFNGKKFVASKNH